MISCMFLVKQPVQMYLLLTFKSNVEETIGENHRRRNSIFKGLVDSKIKVNILLNFKNLSFCNYLSFDQSEGEPIF